MSERITFSDNKRELLVADVGRFCPLCKKENLFYEKNGRLYRKYEIAHIYPLNPKEKEKKILKGVEILGNDSNDLDNLIILCRDCHKKFDNPRTREEYENILLIKKKHIEDAKKEERYKILPIEESLKIVLSSLTNHDVEKIEISYDAKTIDNKLKGEVKPIFLKKIRSNVSEYFGVIQGYLRELDEEKTSTSEIIANQIRNMFLEMNRTEKNKEKLFNNIKDWINKKNDELYPEAAEIIVSYFVQNCEVFNEITK